MNDLFELMEFDHVYHFEDLKHLLKLNDGETSRMLLVMQLVNLIRNVSKGKTPRNRIYVKLGTISTTIKSSQDILRQASMHWRPETKNSMRLVR